MIEGLDLVPKLLLLHTRCQKTASTYGFSSKLLVYLEAEQRDCLYNH